MSRQKLLLKSSASFLSNLNRTEQHVPKALFLTSTSSLSQSCVAGGVGLGRRFPKSLSAEHFTGSVFGPVRGISLFSTGNNKKKSAPNSEPHINDAKARPAEQGMRLDEDPSAVNHTHNNVDMETEAEKQLRTELNKAVSENATLLSKTRELEDKYLRALAETENVRTRLTKQAGDAKLYATQGFCKDMTEIADILSMAIQSVPQDQVTDNNKHLKQLYEGLKMTDAQLLQVFARHGLTPINPIDTKFNPNEHEAVVQQEVAGKETGTVIFVSKIGYKLNGRVIRPAVVGVAK